jgi:hypothetical protein
MEEALRLLAKKTRLPKEAENWLLEAVQTGKVRVTLFAAELMRSRAAGKTAEENAGKILGDVNWEKDPAFIWALRYLAKSAFGKIYPEEIGAIVEGTLEAPEAKLEILGGETSEAVILETLAFIGDAPRIRTMLKKGDIQNNNETNPKDKVAYLETSEMRMTLEKLMAYALETGKVEVGKAIAETTSTRPTTKMLVEKWETWPSKEFVENAINMGWDVKEAYKDTPGYALLAAANKSTDIVETILNAGANETETRAKSAYLAAKKGKRDNAEILIDNDELRNDPRMHLAIAMSLGDNRKVKEILEGQKDNWPLPRKELTPETNNAYPDPRASSPMTVAVHTGNEEAFMMLLDMPLTPQEKEEMVETACLTWPQKVQEVLERANIPENTASGILRSYAALVSPILQPSQSLESEQAGVVTALMAAGAKPDAEIGSEAEKDALSWATLRHMPWMVEALMKGKPSQGCIQGALMEAIHTHQQSVGIDGGASERIGQALLRPLSLAEIKKAIRQTPMFFPDTANDQESLPDWLSNHLKKLEFKKQMGSAHERSGPTI